MAPYCFKKNKELKIVIDYYENRITGTEAISQINLAVRQKLRGGVVRKVAELSTYVEAKHKIARDRGMKAAEAKRKPAKL